MDSRLTRHFTAVDIRPSACYDSSNKDAPTKDAGMTHQQQQIPAIFEQARDAVSWLQVQVDLRGLDQKLLELPWRTYHLSVKRLHEGRMDRAVHFAELTLKVTKERLTQIDANP